MSEHTNQPANMSYPHFGGCVPPKILLAELFLNAMMAYVKEKVHVKYSGT